MKRTLALERISDFFSRYKDRVEETYIQLLGMHQKELIEDLLNTVLQLKKYYPIRILQFQIMRSDLYQKKYRIEVCGYNKRWYLDEERTKAYCDISYLFQPFKELAEELEAEIFQYMGAISQYDIDNMVNEFFVDCFYRSASKIREGFFLFDEWLQQHNRSYRKPYCVMWGDYRGKTDILFFQDKPGKDTELFLKACESDKKEGHYFFSFVASMLEEITVSGENFAYLNFKRSKLQEVTFEKCSFLASLFKENTMDWCTFADSRLYGCNFSEIKGYQLKFENTTIMNTTFENAQLRKGNFSNAKLIGVDFQNSDLSECSFKGATLSMVDLRVASLKDIDLTGAKLREVYINEEDIPLLQLTKEQRENVYVLRED